MASLGTKELKGIQATETDFNLISFCSGSDQCDTAALDLSMGVECYCHLTATVLIMRS